MKKGLIRNSIGEIYSSLPKKNYPTNKNLFNQIDEIWSNGLADFSEYMTSNSKRYRYIFVIIDFFSKYTWCVPLKKTVKN